MAEPIIKFQNPQNGYVEEYNAKTSFLLCLLFGPVYWLARGNIPHALISIVLAICSFSISWFLYPFFANRINIKAYLRRGWIRLDNQQAGVMPIATSQLMGDSAPKAVQTTLSATAQEKSYWAMSPGQVIVLFVIGILFFLWFTNYLENRDSSSGSALYEMTHDTD